MSREASPRPAESGAGGGADTGREASPRPAESGAGGGADTGREASPRRAESGAGKGRAPDIDSILDELTEILVEVIGEDFLLEIEVTPTTTFSADLELESIEFVAVAEKLQNRYGARVDFTAFLAGLSIDQILELTVGELAEHIRRSLASGSTSRDSTPRERTA